MELIKDNNQILKHVYTSNHHWLDDYSCNFQTEYVFEIDTLCLSNLIDTVCAHINQWLFILEDRSENVLKVRRKIAENILLKKLIQDDNLLSPEYLVIIFGGSVVYNIDEDLIKYRDEDDSIECNLQNGEILTMSREEFEMNHGTVEFPEEEDDEVLIWYSCSNVFLFLTPEQEKTITENLLSCINELNSIYKSMHMQQIVLR
jgi:hypothetical protein